jgi:hypothetical protein
MSTREDLDRLRQELAECIYAAGDARHGYREPLDEGLSRQQLFNEVLRLLDGTDPLAPARKASPEPPAASDAAEHKGSSPPMLALERTPEPVARSDADDHKMSTAEQAASRIQPAIEAEPSHISAEANIASSGSDEPRRPAARFSKLRRVLAGISIFIALTAAVVGGLLLVVRPPPPKPITAVASIPDLSIQSPIQQEDRKGPAETADASIATDTRPAPDPEPPGLETQQITVPSTVATEPVVPQGTQAKETQPTAVIPTDTALVPVTAPPIQNDANALSKEAVPELLAQGDARFAAGDLASARLLYERAANAGDAQAALRLGQSYDPYFLAFTHFTKVRGSPATAAQWYLQADKLGAAEAQGLLRALASDLGLSAPSQSAR